MPLCNKEKYKVTGNTKKIKKSSLPGISQLVIELPFSFCSTEAVTSVITHCPLPI